MFVCFTWSFRLIGSRFVSLIFLFAQSIFFGDFADVRRKQQLDVENLSLTTDPYQTLKLFFSALIFYLRKSLSYVLRNCGWILGMTIIAYASWTFLIVNILSEEVRFHFIFSFHFFCIWMVYVLNRIRYNSDQKKICGGCDLVQDIQESLHYLRFGLWWISLGVASSIGLGKECNCIILCVKINMFFILF